MFRATETFDPLDHMEAAMAGTGKSGKTTNASRAKGSQKELSDTDLDAVAGGGLGSLINKRLSEERKKNVPALEEAVRKKR